MNEPKPINPRKNMPDITMEPTGLPQVKLDWVGMSGVHLPIRLMDGDQQVTLDTKADIFVDLNDPVTKGIHMSRLYLLLNDFASQDVITPSGLGELSQLIMQSHSQLSSSSLVKFEFERLIQRKALLSDNYGWNGYPIELTAVYTDGQLSLEISLSVLYSSTCPCSTALAWQLNKERFDLDFAGRGQLSAEEVGDWLMNVDIPKASPHSQRSVAKVRVKLTDSAKDSFPLTFLINLLETTLQTPVQTAVKREDEQEFARLNGRNTMFCEDAARRIKIALLAEPAYSDFRIRVDHVESLHAHNATAVATKGLRGGYAPIL